MTDSSQAVFLSYASQDAAAVERIAAALRAAGVEVWFDQNELVGGDAWDAKIRKQIAECALFVPVISAATQARREGYFRLEWKLAAQRTHMISDDTPFLLPVVIDDTLDGEARVPAEFKAVQWTRLRAGEADARARDAFGARVLRVLDDASGVDPKAGAVSGKTTEKAEATSVRGKEPAPAAGGRATWRSVGVAVAGLVVIGAVVGWWRREQSPPQGGTVVLARGANPAVADVLARVRPLRMKIDVTRADLDAASGLLELADRQHPNQADIWAEWSLVDGRYLEELFDRSDARREAMRQRALRAYGLAPGSATARLAHASALAAMNRGDSAVSAQARALLEPLAETADVDPQVLVLLSAVSRERKNPAPSFRYLDRLARMPGYAALAHLERGIGLVFGERWAEAEVEIDRALAVERTTKCLMWKSYIQAMWHGDLAGARQSIAEIPAAFLAEDFPAAACFWVHLWSRDWDRALAVMRGLPRDYLNSGALSGPTGYFKGWVLGRAGKTAAAETELRSALEVVDGRLKAQPNARSALVAKGLVQFALGERDAAERTRRLVEELYGEEPREWIDSFLSAELLPPEEAIRRLTRQVETSAFATAARLRLDPYLDPLRAHPQFAELQARVDADPRLSPKAAKRPAAPPEKSIAVLAFENRSEDKSNEDFSDGISDELLNQLGRVPGLQVAGRLSAFSFKGRSVTDAEIARTLGVAYLVNGSVQRSGSTVRITARLNRAVDGVQLWSESFTKELRDVFAVQDEIAGRIAQNLQLKLGYAPRTTRVVNPEAHRLVLEGRHFWMLRNDEGFTRAEGAFRGALRLDPEFAEAHAGLADVAVIRGWYSALGDGPAAADLTLAREEATIALRIDPTLAGPHAALGVVHLNEWKLAEAEQSFLTALRLNPNYAYGHHWRAHLMALQGRIDEALASLERAVQLDPLSFITLAVYAMHLEYAGRNAEAVAMADRALALRSDLFVPLQATRALALWNLGRKDDALAAARVVTADPLRAPRWWTDHHIMHVLQEAGLERERVSHLSQLEKAPPGVVPPLVLLAGAGKATEALERIAERRLGASVAVTGVFFGAAWEGLRRDPRFPAAVTQAGLTEEYRRAQETRARLQREREAKP